MIIGVQREIKDNENRVGMPPSRVKELVGAGHRVLVCKDAGVGSGFSNREYEEAGAKIVESDRVWADADMIIKIKEPLREEWPKVRKSQIIFTYFHLAPDKRLTETLMKTGATCVAYETIQDENGRLPCLAPMSEVAGRMAPQVGAYYLSKPSGGRGVLLGQVTGVSPATVAVIGGGFVGVNAASMAAGMGGNVKILEINPARVEQLNKTMPKNVEAVLSNKENVEKCVKDADLLIGAALVPGSKAPVVVSRDLVAKMKDGAVIVDVAIDQGGCVETSRPTSHSNPVYKVGGVTHYCVTNMPGAYPRTSTMALTNATIKYALKLAERGERALLESEGFLKGLNIYKGKLTCKPVADAHGLSYTDPKSLL